MKKSHFLERPLITLSSLTVGHAIRDGLLDTLVSTMRIFLMNKEKTYAVCEECGSLDIEGSANVFWDHVVGEWTLPRGDWIHDSVWCSRCEGECNVCYIPENILKVWQVTKRLKGESV